MQGQLGVDLKNPIIHIETSDDEKRLYVYIGFLYFTSIPKDKKSVQYRLLVGQLALTGFSITSLMSVFGFSRPTVMRYRDIVETSANEKELFDRLRGYHCKKTKLTPEVEAYIKARFETVYKVNRKSYNSQLRQEVLKNFGVELSTEAHRQVIAHLRHELDSKQKVEQEVSYEDSEPQTQPNLPFVSEPDIETEEPLFDKPFSLEIDHGVSESSPLIEIEPISSCKNAESSLEVIPAKGGSASVQKDEDKGKLFMHAGLLVLNLWLADFAAGYNNWRDIFLQWLYQIFAGAVNHEQSRYLARHELGSFIGQAAASVSKSRLVLKNLAHKYLGQCLQLLFEVNLKCTRKHLQDKPCYFYVDGHFDPYYGIIEILKGWCCILNRAMKGTNHYTINDSVEKVPSRRFCQVAMSIYCNNHMVSFNI